MDMNFGNEGLLPYEPGNQREEEQIGEPPGQQLEIRVWRDAATVVKGSGLGHDVEQCGTGAWLR